MRNRFRLLISGAAVAATLLVSTTLMGQARGGQAAPTPATAPARGQATTPQRGAAPAAAGIPRMPDGKPNFTGLWQAMTGANWDIQDHSAEPGPFYQLGAAFAIPAGQGIVEGNDIPYRPEALEQRRLNRLNRWTADPETKCYMPGIPRANYMPYPFQIVQGTTRIAIAYEFATSNRVVNMAAPTKPPVVSWMGWSNGKWEGDTLVIEVSGNNEQTWFDRAGNFHSDAMKVTERFTFRNADVINYEATISDPKTFTRDWKISFPIYRRLENNAKLLEFKCVEFTEELIYGHLRKPTN
jgi:hypothetical protein